LDRDGGGEVNNHLIIVCGPAAAAFNPHITSEWQRDIEGPGSAVDLSRERALRHWGAGSDANVINVLFVLVPGRVEVESGRIRHVAPGIVRNNCDVIAYLALVRI